MDPYSIFFKKFPMQLNLLPAQYINIKLKSKKDDKYDTLFIGGSEVGYLFDHNNGVFNKYFNIINLDYISSKNLYHLIKSYIKLHPETKNVYIIISCNSFFIAKSKDILEITDSNYSIKELLFLLLSKETTIESINKAKNNIRYFLINNFSKNFKNKKNSGYNGFCHYIFPNMPPIIFNNLKLYKEPLQNNIYYIEKTLQLLKDNKISYKIIFPPCHAIYLSLLYLDEDSYDLINQIKRYITKISDNCIYDFAIINNYTTVDYKKNKYLFTEYSHPSLFFGMKIFKYFHDNISEKDLFLKLDKNNIEKQLKYEKEKIKNYLEKNGIPDEYINWNKYHSPNENKMETQPVYFNDAPDYIKKEIRLYEYNQAKVMEEIRKGQYKKGKFDYKFYTEISD